MQALLWDRRLVGAVLDHLEVPMPKRIEVSRDGGPKVDEELQTILQDKLGLKLGGLVVCPEVHLSEDGNSIIVDDQVMEKPFVEKPVSGEDHNVYIYFRDGGGRRLFRKVSFGVCVYDIIALAIWLFKLMNSSLSYRLVTNLVS